MQQREIEGGGIASSLRVGPSKVRAAKRYYTSGSLAHAVEPDALASSAAAPARPQLRLVADAAPAQEPHFGYFATKRAVDVGVALLALIVLSPLFLAVAVAIKLDSRGPVFYRHTRVGERGRWFQCYKFRSMEEGADARWRELRHLDITGGPTFKCERDPRVTRVGRFIRRTSIDELPQLFNVLRGDMSLVGPRPPLPAEVDAYTDYETARLSVAPGITCLWQVSGRSRLSFEEWIRLDLEYIERRCLVFDLYVLLRTVPAVLTMRGAV